jgi:VanZ family protein
MTGFALALELVQWPLPGRDSSFMDFVVSSASAALGLLVVLITEHVKGAGQSLARLRPRLPFREDRTHLNDRS